MNNLYWEFIELLFMILTMIYTFYLHYNFNDPLCFFISYVIFIKITLRILILCDGSD